jgi:hypothetical protein
MGRQDAAPPEEVVAKVAEAVRRLEPADAEIDGMLVRKHLKAMRLGKHHPHANAIANRLTSNKAHPQMDHVVEDDLRHWFSRIQTSFERNKGPKRKSFLNFNYVIRQLLALMVRDQSHLFQKIPMIKSRARIKQHDAIWEKVCADVGLVFKPLLPILPVPARANAKKARKADRQATPPALETDRQARTEADRQERPPSDAGHGA